MATSSETASGSTTDHAERNGLVVGIDGSDGAATALAWATARVDRYGPLRPLIAWRYPTWVMADPMLGAPPPVPIEEFEAAARRRAEEALASVPESARRPVVVIESAAGPALVEEGADANLIVVGTRGRGAVADTILGSVSCHTVSHAVAPVAVIPAGAAVVDERRRVIVGVDGSENSVRALVWALQNSAPESQIEAVHAWSHQAVAIPEPYVAPVGYPEEEAKATLERVVVEAGVTVAGAEARVIQTLEYGDARTVLRRRSTDGDKLVVGARGHRGVAHLLLGSVSTGLIHQPLVPTIVVPDTGS